MAEKKLNPRQERFVREYLKDLNATQAAERAGYKKSPHLKKFASNLLNRPEVAEAIRAANDRRVARIEVAGDVVLRRLIAIAGASFKNVATWDNNRLALFPSEELSEDTAAQIESIKIKSLKNEEGDEIGIERQIKMRNPVPALELLSRHLGMLDGQGGSNPDDELKHALDELDAEEKAAKGPPALPEK